MRCLTFRAKTRDLFFLSSQVITPSFRAGLSLTQSVGIILLLSKSISMLECSSILSLLSPPETLVGFRTVI